MIEGTNSMRMHNPRKIVVLCELGTCSVHTTSECSAQRFQFNVLVLEAFIPTHSFTLSMHAHGFGIVKNELKLKLEFESTFQIHIVFRMNKKKSLLLLALLI